MFFDSVIEFWRSLSYNKDSAGLKPAAEFLSRTGAILEERRKIDMYCTNCGKELPDGASVCDECGTPTGSQDARQENTAGGHRPYNTRSSGCSLAAFYYFPTQEVFMDYLSVFIEMLQAKNLTANTIRNYQTYLKPYLSYLQERGISPEHVSWETVRDFLKTLQASRHLSDRTMNMVISILQFFWIYVLHQPWDTSQIPFRKFRTYLPFVPDRRQVALFLNSLGDPKARLACSILYAAGLRLDELCHLECRYISLSSHRLYIPVSKNHSDRYVPIPESICKDIRDYWYSCTSHMKPKTWLFTQQTNRCNPMDKQWLQRIILGTGSRLAWMTASARILSATLTPLTVMRTALTFSP